MNENHIIIKRKRRSRRETEISTDEWNLTNLSGEVVMDRYAQGANRATGRPATDRSDIQDANRPRDRPLRRKPRAEENLRAVIIFWSEHNAHGLGFGSDQMGCV